MSGERYPGFSREVIAVTGRTEEEVAADRAKVEESKAVEKPEEPSGNDTQQSQQ